MQRAAELFFDSSPNPRPARLPASHQPPPTAAPPPQERAAAASAAARTKMDISSMSVKEMKQELTELGGGAEGCYERPDIEARLLELRARNRIPSTGASFTAASSSSCSGVSICPSVLVQQAN
jgi:hypothetical protein